ncbi:GntR family transcriptional regulator [Croceicoccus marinus]|uniref:GntR family transcriptional regulator n=2 Tax=Croceicoccus marinus TaxID=450378 RepID=A0A7G6VZ29_9SPHN|nr:GntR family transcriptional regulator [Croceicoccus marinus]QNE06994.1 GntR family transcriptional regulator [Croceicoccus marinus]
MGALDRTDSHMPSPGIKPQVALATGSQTPLQPNATRAEAVADRLRLEIVSARIAPGTLLRETAVAEQLGVSPTPVREAFAALAAEGLLQVEAHRLKRVTPIDLAATHDLLRVQTKLWRFGYEWGMPNVGPEEIARLGHAIEIYRDALDRGHALAAIRAGHEFHSVFIIASANAELLRSTLDRRSLIARFILLHGSTTISKAGLRKHKAILACLKRGDADGVLIQLDELAARLLAMAGDRDR